MPFATRADVFPTLTLASFARAASVFVFAAHAAAASPANLDTNDDGAIGDAAIRDVTVDDVAALWLLNSQYSGRVALRGAWKDVAGDRDTAPADASATVSREVCADSGAGAWPRLIAVCTAYPDAGHVSPGAVDLWLLREPRRRGEAARLEASRIDIATGSFGNPGAVRLIDIGPQRRGFALASGYTSMGWSLETQALYAADGESFVELFQLSTALDNSGACDRDADRDCVRQSVSLECRLRADTARVDDGRYDFLVEIRGNRGGKDVDRTLRIPHRDGAYRVPAAELKRAGCDERAR